MMGVFKAIAAAHHEASAGDETADEPCADAAFKCHVRESGLMATHAGHLSRDWAHCDSCYWHCHRLLHHRLRHCLRHRLLHLWVLLLRDLLVAHLRYFYNNY